MIKPFAVVENLGYRVTLHFASYEEMLNLIRLLNWAKDNLNREFEQRKVAEELYYAITGESR